MNGSESGEKDPSIAVCVAPSEVEQVDFVGTLEERHLVFECVLRQSLAVIGLENSLGGYCLILRGAVGDHFPHIGLRVFLHDDVDSSWKFDVSADVVAVCVRVDKRSDWLVGQSLDLVEYRLTPPRIFRVDNDNTIRGDEHRCIPTATLEYKQILFELFDFDDFG